MDLEVKHRQLEHPLANSMASFDFTSAVPDEGTIFIFGSWVCIANGLSGFNSHLADTRELEAPAVTRCNDLDELVDKLDETLLPDLAREIKGESVSNATSTRAAPKHLGSDLIRSGEERTEFSFRLHNVASVYQ
jgi:hypothetical protein